MKENFVLWQAYDHSENGMKMMTFYKIKMVPYTMVVDPLTGARLAGWEGFIDPERLLEVLVPFMEKSPTATGSAMPNVPVSKLHTSKSQDIIDQSGDDTPMTLQGDGTLNAPIDVTGTGLSSEEEEIARAIAASMEESRFQNNNVHLEHDDNGISEGVRNKGKAKEEEVVNNNDTSMPVDLAAPIALAVSDPETAMRDMAAILPEEPDASDKNSFRIAVRLPDGQRVVRRFTKSANIKVLYVWCRSLVRDAAIGKGFKLSQTIPGAAPLVESDGMTLVDAGVQNAMLAMVWT